MTMAAVGGALGFTFGALQGLDQNKRLAEAAERNLEGVQGQMRDVYRDMFRREESLSRTAGSELAQIGVGFGRTGAGQLAPGRGFEGGASVATGDTGSSINSLFAQMQSDVQQTAREIKQTSMSNIEQLKLEKESIREGARGQQTMAIMPALEGGMSGFQQGAQIDQAMAAKKASEEMAKLSETQRKLAGQGADIKTGGAKTGLNLVTGGVSFLAGKFSDFTSQINAMRSQYQFDEGF